MKCLILAAGKGTRLRQVGNVKPLIPIMGMPLIERVIRSALEVGVDGFYVTVGYQGEQVRVFLEGLALRLEIPLISILNEDWNKENGLSVLKAREYLHEPFLLLMGDHIVDKSILAGLIREGIGEGEVVLAVDRGRAGGKRTNVHEATKVLVEDRRIVDIGKDIEKSNAYDTGVFLCSPAIFSALERSVEGGDSSLSGGIRVLARQGKARTFDIGRSYWVDVDDEKQVREAERVLFDSLIKPADGLIARYVNRPFSTRIFTPLLLRLYKGITPNQVSILSSVVALASGLLFFVGRPVAGALLIQLASILDGCDGEIARLKHMQSSFGDFFDAILDRYADGFILLGMVSYLLNGVAGQEVLGLYWSPLAVIIIAGSAILGNLMVSYTSAKSVVNFGYRYKGGWIAAGRGRDRRLFQLFVGGLLAPLHPIFALFAILIVAVQTNLIVLRRTLLSWNLSLTKGPLMRHRVRAIIFDFDGTVANTMPFLTELATRLMAETYGISPDVARERYLELSGMDFASQIEMIFPGDPRNQEVVNRFESIKEKEILAHPIFPEAISTFQFFRSKGIRIFLCSSTRQEIVERYVRLYKVEEYIEALLGYKPGFGKSEQIAFILRHHGFNPREVLFVGDSLRDLDYISGKGTGFIGVAGTFRKKDFRQLGTQSVSGLRELVRLFDRWEKRLEAVENTR